MYCAHAWCILSQIHSDCTYVIHSDLCNSYSILQLKISALHNGEMHSLKKKTKVIGSFWCFKNKKWYSDVFLKILTLSLSLSMNSSSRCTTLLKYFMTFVFFLFISVFLPHFLAVYFSIIYIQIQEALVLCLVSVQATASIFLGQGQNLWLFSD